MEPFTITRQNITDKLQEITVSTKNKDAVKTAMQMWMQNQQCGDFEIKQIMNDLTSYPEYLDLLN